VLYATALLFTAYCIVETGHSIESPISIIDTTDMIIIIA
jgi:hypothetical protein